MRTEVADGVLGVEGGDEISREADGSDGAVMKETAT